jgi:hypothetical protein
MKADFLTRRIGIDARGFLRSGQEALSETTNGAFNNAGINCSATPKSRIGSSAISK